MNVPAKQITQAIERQQALLSHLEKLEADLLSLMSDIHHKENLISSWAVEVTGRIEHIDRSVQEAIQYSRGIPTTKPQAPDEDVKDEQPPAQVALSQREAMLKRLRERTESESRQ